MPRFPLALRYSVDARIPGVTFGFSIPDNDEIDPAASSVYSDNAGITVENLTVNSASITAEEKAYTAGQALVFDLLIAADVEPGTYKLRFAIKTINANFLGIRYERDIEVYSHVPIPG